MALFCPLILAQTLPYNPTSILLPSDRDFAYVFLPSQSNAADQLLSLDISSTLSVSNFSLGVVTSTLPFRTNGNLTAFVPAISSSGDISVYAGSCSTSSSAQLWTYAAKSASTGSVGSWTNDTTSTASDITSADLPGANFLSRGLTFSNYVDGNVSDSSIYIFGGMCPNGSATSWQSSATYSSHMLRLAPQSSSYTLDITSSRGGPVAEAGFTITGLTPTYSNNTDPVTQQQNYVLLGGHTQTAFINMSQIAIWSLPEETWSFVTVDSPSPTSPNTELAVKSVVTSVDSRSGHTSVLSEDGTKIIVAGGWVGDISQAATPQLAILDLGTGFGGTGDWQWSIPSHQPSGSGMYGHGAVMLPGNVMMILGGYNISSSASMKRDVSPAGPVMFFNATSLTWITDYTNPNYIVGGNAASSSSNTTSSAKKIALGVGLGLGLTIILVLVLIYCCYKRHLRAKRVEEREKHIQSLSAGPAQYYAPNEEIAHGSSSFSWSRKRWNRARGSEDFDQDLADDAVGYENLNTGIHNYGRGVPAPPKHIKRKPLHSQGAHGRYQPTPPAFDFNAGGSSARGNSLGTAGVIHPIYEADEDDRISQSSGHDGIGIAMGNPPVGTILHHKRHSDPFRDAHGMPTDQHRRDGSESPARSREREIQEWVSDWAAADAIMQSRTHHSSAGRVSPTRRARMVAASSISSVSGEEDSGRTASNLSERSIAASAVTLSRSGSSSQRSRSDSLRGFITNAMSPFGATVLSTTVASTTQISTFDSGERGLPPGSSGSSSSFVTAHTSFGALQAEAEGLLPRPDDAQRHDEDSPTYSNSGGSGSPSKNKPLVRRGWLGSIRRVIAPTRDTLSPSDPSPDPSYDSRTPSPIRIGETLQPRRTVSASATLWRRKQGKVDWEDSEVPGPRSNTLTGDVSPARLAENTDDDEWDIERAVENRVVQVMFSVPRERLRVVNHDFTDEDKSEVNSMISRGGSLKDPPVPAVVESLMEDSAEVNEKSKDKGKSKEVVDEGKGKSRVQDIVEKIEGLSTPERQKSPERS